LIAEIIIDIENKQVNRSFDYLIPPHLENIIEVGYRVKVPFGNTIRVGFVVGIKKDSEFKNKLKEIIDTIDVYKVLNEEFIDISKYIAENNFSFYATSLQTMIPTALKIKYQRVAIIEDPDIVSDDIKNIIKRKEIIIDNLPKDKQELIFKAYKNGGIRLDTKIKKNRNEKKLTFVRLKNPDIIPGGKKARELLEYLKELNEDIELNVLVADSGYSKAIIDSLIRLGAINTYDIEVLDNEADILIDDNRLELNDEQKNVFEAVKFNEAKTYLLHGVTGSGKTLVYMNWIESVIKEGRSAILLVPEISLTPQITQLFKKRFNNDIAILHSRLSITEKYNAWKKILLGEIKIVVGARSAIFAPLRNIGIIIIDEAHESTYRQQNNPKYDAIDIAQIRCKTHNAPLVLGSATPDVVQYYKALEGEYELLTLPNRANGKKLPATVVVDMTNELKCGNRSVLSKYLQKSLIECIRKNEQAILFLNRRGYSSFVMCRSCGDVVKCPNCDVSLTYHAKKNILKCHYCGYQMPNVSRCTKCNSDKIRYVGTGTEKVIEAVNNLIPEAKVLRVDMDTTSKIEDYEAAYDSFKNHETDILVGTQMITKGLDFDNVTLVGVLNADLALNYPLYDASMVAFNLIEQVSGRAGRSNKDGKVVIQSYNPNHYVIKNAMAHDYEGFYRFEIQKRKMSMMPPFADFIEISLESSDCNLCYLEAVKLKKSLENSKTTSTILGPTEAPIFKKNNIYKFIISVLATDELILDVIKNLYPTYQNNKDINLSITRM